MTPVLRASTHRRLPVAGPLSPLKTCALPCSENRRAAVWRPPVDPWMEPARNHRRTLPAYHMTTTPVPAERRENPTTPR